MYHPKDQHVMINNCFSRVNYLKLKYKKTSKKTMEKKLNLELNLVLDKKIE